MLPPYTAYREPAPIEVIEPAPSVSHFVHVVHSHRKVILLAMICTALGYVLFAILVYLLSPSQHVISLSFRLDFSGATAGTYPNGRKFSTNDITNLPVLLKIYQTNHLDRHTKFPPFARSIYVIERNAAYERLQAEYQARLADPKLTPVDRERMEKEFQAKREGLNKNEYAINYVISDETRRIPDALGRKVLAGVLSEWSRYVAAQGALNYDVPVLSPAFVEGAEPLEANLIASVLILRSKITQVLSNLATIEQLPGVNLIGTHDGMSVDEIRIRLEDLQRFRVEPLATVVQKSGLIGNQAAAIHFVESQLEYDQRQLRTYQQKVDAIKQTLAAYSQGLPQRPTPAEQNAKTTGKPAQAQPGETVMPQITDTFLDRLVQLSNMAGDQQYRQKLTEQMGVASLQMIPVQDAVDYDNQLLKSMRSSTSKVTGTTAEYVRAELASSKAELRQMIVRINEIYQGVSQALNPSSQLYSLTAPPITSVQRGVSLPRLGLYGVLVLLMALLVSIALCLVHDRVREQEAAEAEQAGSS